MPPHSHYGFKENAYHPVHRGTPNLQSIKLLTFWSSHIGFSLRESGGKRCQDTSHREVWPTAAECLQRLWRRRVVQHSQQVNESKVWRASEGRGQLLLPKTYHVRCGIRAYVTHVPRPTMLGVVCVLMSLILQACVGCAPHKKKKNYQKKEKLAPGVVAHACNPST